MGRADELHLMKELLHATGREGRARLVSIMGAAGIGKSRLAWEFLKYVDGVTEDVWWHNGRSPSYGEGISFWALGEMIRSRAGLTADADEATTRERIAATVREHVPDESERRWIEPALLALLGIGAEAHSSEQLFAAWRTFFERMAQTGTVALVFEDLHWADPGTLDFIEHILEWSRAEPDHHRHARAPRSARASAGLGRGEAQLQLRSTWIRCPRPRCGSCSTGSCRACRRRRSPRSSPARTAFRCMRSRRSGR